MTLSRTHLQQFAILRHKNGDRASNIFSPQVAFQDTKGGSEANMSLLKSKLAGVALILIVGTAGCGMIQPHVDCNQVSLQQRGGENDAEIAKATGYSVAD